jgi:hypothetical protein
MSINASFRRCRPLGQGTEQSGSSPALLDTASRARRDFIWQRDYHQAQQPHSIQLINEV